MTNKPFKHFDSIKTFNSKKVSVNASNTSYIQNGATHSGAPEVLWTDACFIRDIGQIWTRGRIYDNHKYLGTLARMSKDTYFVTDRTIISIIDKNPETAYGRWSRTINGERVSTPTGFTIYEPFSYIVPSLVVTPSVIDSVNGGLESLHNMLDCGSDVLAPTYNGTVVVDQSKSDSINYYNTQTDIFKVNDWMTLRGLFTNCFFSSYDTPPVTPNPLIEVGPIDTLEAKFICQYKEYRIRENFPDKLISPSYCTRSNLNNMNIISYRGTSLAEIKNYLKNILDSNNTVTELCCIVITLNNGCNDKESIYELAKFIDGYVNPTLPILKKAYYMPVTEALKVMAPKFNIGTTFAKSGFRVLGDGTPDFALTEAQLTQIKNKFGL